MLLKKLCGHVISMIHIGAFVLVQIQNIYGERQHLTRCWGGVPVFAGSLDSRFALDQTNHVVLDF